MRNRTQFVRIDLPDAFTLDPFGQKSFMDLGAQEAPIPDELELDLVGEDTPFHVRIPHA